MTIFWAPSQSNSRFPGLRLEDSGGTTQQSVGGLRKVPEPARPGIVSWLWDFPAVYDLVKVMQPLAGG